MPERDFTVMRRKVHVIQATIWAHEDTPDEEVEKLAEEARLAFGRLAKAIFDGEVRAASPSSTVEIEWAESPRRVR